jgi:catechol 2,3-dioxygenase-like lactoylglutathione lyase family enzyme
MADVAAGLDHVDCRVRSVTLVEAFYDALMPLLGWTGKGRAHVDDSGEWHDVDDDRPYNAVEYYEPHDGIRAPHFVGFIEDVGMLPTATRIAFSIGDPSALDEWEARLAALGARNVERSEDMDFYPAIFFEDPAGTRLEICSRRVRAATGPATPGGGEPADV